MSTYTDLHNKIKETINVDYKTRATTQEVKLLNNDNEYWGTFKGDVEVNSASISGGTITDVTIKDSVLDNVKLPNGLDLGDVNDKFTTIDETLYSHGYRLDVAEQDIKSLEEEDRSLDSKITTINDSINDAITTINNKLSVYANTPSQTLSAMYETQVKFTQTVVEETYDKLVDKYNQLDTKFEGLIEDEAKVREDRDKVIDQSRVELEEWCEQKYEELKNSNSTLLTEFDGKIEEVNDNAYSLYADNLKTINKTKAELQAVDKALDEKDKQLSSEIDALVEKTTEDLNNIETEFLENIAHDKHYTINNSGIVTKYPYQLEEFAVNVVKLQAVGGYVMYDNEVVGNIRKDANDGTVIVQIYEVKNEDLKKVLQQSTFMFGKDEKNNSKPTGINNYNIIYRPGATDAGDVFDITPNQSEYLDVVSDEGFDIGNITEFEIDENGILKSGQLTINSYNPLLQDFVDFKQVALNGEAIHYNENDQIIYDGNNGLILKKNVLSYEYQPLVTVDNETFGRVYKRDVIKDEAGNIESMKVYIDGTINKNVVLNKNNNFAVKLSDSQVVSADISEDGISIDVVDVNALYKYDFYQVVNDEQTAAGYVVPNSINKNILLKEFTELSVNVSKMQLNLPEGTETIVLTLDLPDPTAPITSKSWSYSNVFDNDTIVKAEYDGETLSIRSLNKVTNKAGGKYLIKTDTQEVYNIEEAFTKIYSQEVVSFTYDNITYLADSEYKATIDTTDRHNSGEKIEFQLTVDLNSSKVSFTLPSKKDKEVSRELILAVKIEDATADSVTDLEFVDEDGDLVKYISNFDSSVQVKSNTFTYFQINETNLNEFLIIDLLDNSINDKINKNINDIVELSANVKTNADNISDLYDITTLINNNVSTISANVEAISSDVKALKQKIIGGINFRGEVVAFDDGNGYSTNTISGLFYNNSDGDYPFKSMYDNPNEELLNGYQYIVKVADGSKATQFEIEGVKITKDDYIIVFNHNKEDTILVKDLTSADILVINAQDDDVAKLEDVTKVNNALTAEVERAKNKETDINNALTAEIKRSEDKDTDLDGKIDSEISKLSADLSGEISAENARAISAENYLSGIISNDISTAITTEVDRAKEAEDDLTDKINNLSTHIDNKVKVQVNADGETLSVDTITIHKLGQKEYEALANSNSIITSDVYIVSAEYINGYGQQAKNIANGNEVQDAATYGQLTSNVETLNTSIDATNTRVDVVSSDLSDLTEHYNKTFVKDNEIQTGADIKVDYLKLTDVVANADATYNSYTMQLSAGTIVLVPVKE